MTLAFLKHIPSKSQVLWISPDKNFKQSLSSLCWKDTKWHATDMDETQSAQRVMERLPCHNGFRLSFSWYIRKSSALQLLHPRISTRMIYFIWMFDRQGSPSKPYFELAKFLNPLSWHVFYILDWCLVEEYSWNLIVLYCTFSHLLICRVHWTAKKPTQFIAVV